MTKSQHTTLQIAFAAAFMVAVSACGCVSANGRNERHPSPTSTPLEGSSLVASKDAPDARIQTEWQAAFLEDLSKRAPDTDSWGLFSQGGWGDDGQTVVIRESGATTVFVVPLNARDHGVPDGKVVPANLCSTFESAAGRADNLEDNVTTAFDALEYEYLHARKLGSGKVQVLRRMRFNFVEPQTPAPYTSLRDAFKGLR
jgi:hypothetical protein